MNLKAKIFKQLVKKLSFKDCGTGFLNYVWQYTDGVINDPNFVHDENYEISKFDTVNGLPLLIDTTLDKEKKQNNLEVIMENYESMLHDEQVGILNGILADVVLLKLKSNDNSLKITRGEIFKLKQQLQILPKLRKACNHYPEIKNKIVIQSKNLMIGILD